MAVSAEFAAYVLELLEPLGPIESQPFFGGIGLRSGGRQFAFVMDSTLFFGVGETTRGKYEAAGSFPFSYDTKTGRVMVTRYFEVPPDVLADATQLESWAREAIAVSAERAKPKARSSSARRPPRPN